MLQAGDKFRYWTVQADHGDGTAVCRCVCGLEAAVPESWLRARVSTSCGCRPCRAKNLTGQRFGSLTAEEPLPERAQDNSILWRCRCDCGKETVVSSNKLRTGHTLTCGCHTGVDPARGKTYIDGTCLEILFSEKTPKHNTSGRKGVYQKDGKWCAYIADNGKKRWLGRFLTFEEAVSAREEAEEELRERYAVSRSPNAE